MSIDLVRLKFGLSAPKLALGLASRRFGFDSGVDGDDVSGGVALVRLRSKGLRGVGRRIVGPSEAIFGAVISKSGETRCIFGPTPKIARNSRCHKLLNVVDHGKTGARCSPKVRNTGQSMVDDQLKGRTGWTSDQSCRAVVLVTVIVFAEALFLLEKSGKAEKLVGMGKR